MNWATPETDADAPLPQIYLDAFVDGELAADERALALARLEADAAFKAEACELRLLKDQVRNAYLTPPAVPQQVRRLPEGWSMALAASLILALGVGAGWWAAMPPVSLPLSSVWPACRRATGRWR